MNKTTTKLRYANFVVHHLNEIDASIEDAAMTNHRATATIFEIDATKKKAKM